MTLTSDNTVPTEGTTMDTSPPKKKAGRPVGSKNKPKVVRRKPQPKVTINTEAILANAEAKRAKLQVENLNAQLNSAKLHIETLEKRHKAALAVIGYLEGKVFQ